MCQAISLCSKPISPTKSYVYFMDVDERKVTSTCYCDSHSSIAKKAKETCWALKKYQYPCDVINKWEWDPFINDLQVDRINNKVNDKVVIREFVSDLEPKDVIGDHVILKRNYEGAQYFRINYPKTSRTYRELRGLSVSVSTLEKFNKGKKVPNSMAIKAKVSRKPRGGWMLTDLKPISVKSYKFL